jgi:acetamidase/formamidase
MKRITIDRRKRLAEEPEKGHNCWHEGIPPAFEAALGEEVEIETPDAFARENRKLIDIHPCK